MLYTCDSCHYTFQAGELPSRCPDCGKESINRRTDILELVDENGVPVVPLSQRSART